MKYAFWIIGLLATGAFGANAARAQVAAACTGLQDRLERQNKISDAYQCALERSQQAMRRRAFALRRCRSADRTRLRDVATQRAAVLERCVASRLDQKSRDASTAGYKPGPVTGQGKIGRGAGEQTAGQRIKDLLAEGPRIDQTAVGDNEPAVRDRAFRSGLMWSYAGPLAGMHCVQWKEPSDPHKWDDNFLCTERDFGFQWSFRGPILGRGLKCIQVREKSDPNDWHDNYFCWPRDLAVTFRFSASGRVPGMRCVAIVEPSDPNTWRDNYLCHERKAG